MIGFLILGLGILVVVYMTYPRFLQRRISAARFFRDLPPPQKEQSRLRWGKIHPNLPFFLQLVVLLAILAALYAVEKSLTAVSRQSLGVWIIVDTSASMSTQQEGETRMTAALAELQKTITASQKAAKQVPLCFRLSAFDMEQRDILRQGDASALLQSAKTLSPRSIGTNLDILRRLFVSSPGKDSQLCALSHIVIITDLPAPHWLTQTSPYQVIWRDIALPVDNSGFTSLSATRNPLTFAVSEVQVELAYYHSLPPNSRLTITAPGGQAITEQIISWPSNHTFIFSFVPNQAGLYQFKLSPGGAYSFDDSLQLAINNHPEIRVDWQLANTQWLQQLGWTHDPQNPQLRVTDNPNTPATIPTLIVGPGYAAPRATPVEIRDFIEASPLLQDVNLDVVETLGLPSLSIPPHVTPVLRGMDGSVWLAQSESPACAIVPGLLTPSQDVTGRFSALVFFNAVRWLLQKRDIPPLYQLTSPFALEPAVNRLVLHPEEGNTQRLPLSSGTLANLKPLAQKTNTKPLWPILFLIALVFFLSERLYLLFRPGHQESHTG